jgi:hypothetical protein
MSPRASLPELAPAMMQRNSLETMREAADAIFEARMADVKLNLNGQRAGLAVSVADDTNS